MNKTKRKQGDGGDGSVLHVRAFGGLCLYVDDVRVSVVWGSQKARLLFCCLLVSYDQWVHRDRIIEVLWPGCDAGAGINNFKTTLSRLRKTFSGAHSVNPVITQGEALRINSHEIRLDASEFCSCATSGLKFFARGDLKSARPLLEKAQDLYTGEFLPEEPFNDYLSAARKEYAELNNSVILTLSKIYQEEGNQNALEVIRLLMKSPANALSEA